MHAAFVSSAITRKNRKESSMKKSVVLVALTLIVILSGCTNENRSADTQQAKQSEKIFSEAQSEIGMPNIVNFQQRKLMKMIFELCDKENLMTYTYIKSDYNGTLNFVGKSIGYGVPFSAQFTNPEKIVDGKNIIGRLGDGVPVNLPQADPN